MTKAELFASLHVPGRPLVLYNIWDAGSARAVAEAGAKALTTGSWSVAAAQGFADGEAIPRDVLLDIFARIAAAVDLPVAIDLEGGYGADPAVVAESAGAAVAAGAVGFNFEDQRVGGEGLHPAADQARRIRAMRDAAPDAFLNARTDVFLQAPAETHDGAMLDAAIERGRAYADAGASGLFVPGLVDEALIGRLCGATALPVNIMKSGAAPPVARLAELGVARVSHGPGPYRLAMRALGEAARGIYG